MTSIKGKGRIVCGVALLLVLVILIAFSCARIQAVQEESLKMAQRFHDDGGSSIQNTRNQVYTYDLNEKIDLEGLKTDSGVVQQGVSYTFSNPRLISEDELEKLSGYTNLARRSYSSPKYILVDLLIDNTSDEPSPSLWFSLEAGSVSLLSDETATGALNGYSVDENYVATNEFFYRAEAYSTQRVTYAFELIEDYIGEDHWSHLSELNYSLVYIDYPTKIVVDLGTPEDWL